MRSLRSFAKARVLGPQLAKKLKRTPGAVGQKAFALGEVSVDRKKGTQPSGGSASPARRPGRGPWTVHCALSCANWIAWPRWGLYERRSAWRDIPRIIKLPRDCEWRRLLQVASLSH